jgi:hypothetical protein
MGFIPDACLVNAALQLTTPFLMFALAVSPILEQLHLSPNWQDTMDQWSGVGSKGGN